MNECLGGGEEGGIGWADVCVNECVCMCVHVGRGWVGEERSGWVGVCIGTYVCI